MNARWTPLGPFVIHLNDVRTSTFSGRVAAMAVAQDGKIAFAAAATGGLWRTDDAGVSWKPLTDGLAYEPVLPHANSLACGAIAIDTVNPTRIYLGTGEAEGACVGFRDLHTFFV